MKENMWVKNIFGPDKKIKKLDAEKQKKCDWKNYYGSCDELKEDIKILGKENFLREILYLCPHKKSMSYFET
jgi:hypothetical protein